MNIQEILVILIAFGAALYTLRTFVRQFSSGNATCSGCGCEQAAQKTAYRNRNAIRFKKTDSLNAHQ